MNENLKSIEPTGLPTSISKTSTIETDKIYIEWFIIILRSSIIQIFVYIFIKSSKNIWSHFHSSSLQIII